MAASQLPRWLGNSTRRLGRIDVARVQVALELRRHTVKIACTALILFFVPLVANAQTTRARLVKTEE